MQPTPDLLQWLAKRTHAGHAPDAVLRAMRTVDRDVRVLMSMQSPRIGTLHGGAPVIAGEQWIAPKWLRSGVFA